MALSGGYRLNYFYKRKFSDFLHMHLLLLIDLERLADKKMYEDKDRYYQENGLIRR